MIGERHPWTGVRRWARVHPYAVDVAFAVVVGALAMTGYLVANPTGSQQSQDLLGGVLVVAQTTAFIYRRRSPLVSLVLVALATVAFWVSDYPSEVGEIALLSVYAATAHGGDNRRRVWRVVGGVVALFTVIGILGVLVDVEDLPAEAVVGILIVYLTSAAIGELVYNRRSRLKELEQRAIRAETERDLLARQAVLDERSRIARDLHDVVAHGMTVMVVQAGAAQRLVRTRPDQAIEALEQVQTTGRDALTEMRRMLGVLRSEDRAGVALTPQPTIDDLDQMVQHCVDAGVATELVVEGEPTHRSAGAEMAGYRIVQEALTNVIKHGGRPVRAVVKITYGRDQIRLEVNDDGLGAATSELDAATGHGLIGMRERVALYKGTLSAGPRSGGGFRVSAVIPLERPLGTR
jgi:signal transduction histidine kinase